MIACTAFGLSQTLSWPLGLATSAFAHDGGDDGYESMRHMQQEQQRQAAQAAAEFAKRLQEQQRQQQQQQQQQQTNTGRSDSSQDSQSDSGSSASTPTPTRQNDTTSNNSGSDDRSGNSQSAAGRGDPGKDDNNGKPLTGLDGGDNRPAPTIEKWIKQLGGPQKNANATTASQQNNKSATDPKAIAGKAQAAKAASAKSAGARGQTPPIALPNLATPDILAVNASRKTLDRAKALGFKARPASNFSNLGLAVTALVPPPGMDPAEAKAVLSSDMPDASFAANQKYRIYRTASGSEAVAAGTRPATLNKGGMPIDCTGDHCFGREIIGWKPELRSCVSGMRVGIIDTSVDLGHPAFTGKKLEIHHFGADGAPPGPDWHGTGVTALLAGDTASGTPGMIPDANFYIADIFHADADHEPASDTVSMLRAFDWLDAKGVKIVNMSLSGPPDDLVKKAIEKLSAKGVLFVAAAGNEGPNAPPSYPAAYEDVIAVTAVSKDLQSYRYANRGSYVAVAAPGVAIWTALPGSKEGYHSGTSFATPYVTAALAAIYPGLATKTHTEALQQMQYKDLGAPGRDPVYGQGLLIAPTTCSGGQVANAPQQYKMMVGAAHVGGPTEADQGAATPPATAAFAPADTPAAAPARSGPLSWFGFQPAAKQ